MAEKTLEQLQEEHAEMLATVNDLGLKVPEELQADFTETAAGQAIVSNLDAIIRESRKSVAKKAPTVKKPSAKKAVAVKKPAKASAPKKTVAKKASAAKSAPKPTTARRTTVDEGKKIHWLGKDNPSRKGSGRYERIENIKKHHDKTVKHFLDGGGRSGSLHWCVTNGLIKMAG